MIIDIHTHTFPEKIASRALDTLRHNSHTDTFLDGTCRALSESSVKAGIDLSVILPVATSARQVSHINDSSAAINARTQETGLLSLGCMHPEYEDYKEELSRMQALGLKGFKLHPVYQGVDFDAPCFLRILDRAAELDMVVLTHAGYDIGIPGVSHCSPSMVVHVLKEIPQLKLILAHMGGWQCWDEAASLLAESSVFVDTSFSSGKLTPLPGDDHWETHPNPQMTDEAFVRQIRVFGTHRVLFGTDSPWSDQSESLDSFRALPFTDEEKRAILGENARSLLGL